MSGNQWEVQDGARVLGPYPEEQILTSIGKGLPSNTRVRRAGERAWSVLGEVEPFAAVFRVAVEVEVDPDAGTAPMPPNVAAHFATPPHRGQAHAPWRTVSAAALGFVALVLIVARCAKQPSPEELAAQHASTQAAQASTAAAMSKIEANRQAAEAKMKAAAKVWATYEALPPARRTKDLWKDALAESFAIGADIGPPMNETFREVNMATARKHMAPLVNPESTATGPNFTILVPSKDPTKCLVWGSMWSQEDEALRTSGFKRIHCDGARRISKLTGETIQEGPTEWEVE